MECRRLLDALDDERLACSDADLVDHEQHLGKPAVGASYCGVVDFVRHLVEVLTREHVVVRREAGPEVRGDRGRDLPLGEAVLAQVELRAQARRAAVAWSRAERA